jgi:hypothetical protein
MKIVKLSKVLRELPNKSEKDVKEIYDRVNCARKDLSECDCDNDDYFWEGYYEEGLSWDKGIVRVCLPWNWGKNGKLMKENIRDEVRRLSEKFGWGNVCREWDGDLTEEELMKCIDDGGWQWNYMLSDNSVLKVMNKLELKMSDKERFEFVWNGRRRSPKLRRLMMQWAYPNGTKLEEKLKDELKYREDRDDRRMIRWFMKECKYM